VRAVFTERDSSGHMALRRGFDVRAGEQVLVVEDEESIRKLAVKILEKLGYAVLSAGAPGEAPTLMGYPVAESEDMPNIAADSLSVAFGDFRRGYLIVDRVGIRVTLTAFARVIDPEKAALASTDVNATLYRLIQFAIREAVAARTLDEILAARDTIDREVRAYVTERAAELGAEVGEIGVKDVILPGDVRELLNKVVEAERVAKANIIRRQEETAATRSLLNTAKLMENNPLLLRLKELEALEKLVEKVGRIDLHTGAGTGGFDALLSNLYKLSDGKAADGK